MNGVYLPEDGVCAKCQGIVRSVEGVEEALKAAGFTENIAPAGRALAFIPWCRCPQPSRRDAGWVPGWGTTNSDMRKEQ